MWRKLQSIESGSIPLTGATTARIIVLAYFIAIKYFKWSLKLSAFLKVYSDAGCTTEITHTSDHSTTLNGSVSTGATSIVVNSATSWPAQGNIDIDTGGSLESIPYTSISSSTVNLSKALTGNHTSGVAVVQWAYSLPVGDQSLGILNDGNYVTPVSANTATYYVKNAGDATAQNITIATQSSGSTTSGYADTVVSVTSSSTGFATSVAPSNLTSGSSQQFWICAEVPSGQSNSGNPQTCIINLSYQSV